MKIFGEHPRTQDNAPLPPPPTPPSSSSVSPSPSSLASHFASRINEKVLDANFNYKLILFFDVSTKKLISIEPRPR